MKQAPILDLENVRMEIKALCAAVARINHRLDELTGQAEIHPQGCATDIPPGYPDGTELAHRAKILALVAEAAVLTGIDMGDIFGRSQSIGPAQARQWVYYEANQSGIPFAAIGRILDRDHTTVMHGVAAEAKRRGPSPQFKSARVR